MNQKNNKSLIVLIIILTVLVIGLMGFILYKEFYSDKKLSISGDVLESKSPIGLSEFASYYDYEYMYKNYFTMEEAENYRNFGINDEKYITIENNKLMWNIDNEWKIDSTISEDIYYSKVSGTSGTAIYAVLTKNNNLYYIDYTNILDKLLFEDSDLETISSNLYAQVEYQKVELDIEVSKMVSKEFCFASSGGCWAVIYLQEENGNIYVETYENDEIVFVSLDEFMKDKGNNILNLPTQNSLISKVKVNSDGYADGILDEAGNIIKVKHYIVSEDDNMEYAGTLIVDSNDNLYYFNEKEIKSLQRIKPYDKVKAFNYNAVTHEITIDLINGEKISIEKI